MIGEKHMRLDWLGGKYDEPALVAFSNQNTIRVAGDTPSRGLAQGRDDTDDWLFGGAHPAVTQFSLGDAAVRDVAHKTDVKVLKAFLGRNDGTVVQFP
jgi:hypothetical protein